MQRSTITLSLLLLAGCFGPPSSTEVDEVLKNLDQHVGKRIVVKAKFKSGARCKLADGEWKAYCKGCQYCRGPLVVDSALNLPKEGLDDWPLVLGGTYDGQDIRCTGKLNEVKCHPFDLGPEYVVEGFIEASHPPKLIVKKFWKL